MKIFTIVYVLTKSGHRHLRSRSPRAMRHSRSWSGSSKNLVGRDDAQALRDETLRWVKVKLGVSYPWPGNVRELEQCVRNILIRREYVPARRSDKGKTGLDTALSKATLDVEALTRRYVTHVYFREGSYEAAGRVLEMDRRTVKAKVDARFLSELEKSKAQS